MAYYPTGAVRTNAQGTTTVVFQVTDQGTVKNVTVKKSSGHQSLDDASVQCVQQWLYPPTVNNGASTETSKEANVVWSLNGPNPLLFVIERAAQDCIRKAQPTDAALANATHATVATIRFIGSESNVEITDSSGNDDLDKLVVQCLQELPPGIAGHAPVRFGFSIPFLWHVEAHASPAAASAGTPR